MLLIYRMVKLTKYISIPIFIMSLAIGIFIVYMTTDETRTIYIYPTPENVELMLYKDKADQSILSGICFFNSSYCSLSIS